MRKPPACRSMRRILPELRKLGMMIAREVEKLRRVVHPNDAGPRRHLRHDLHRAGAAAGCAPAQRHDLRGCGSRSIAVRHRHRRGDGGAQRHGTAAGRCAVRAREHRRHDLHGPRASSGLRSARRPAIVPEIEGSAWITGEHTFLIDGDDPLKAGFRSVTPLLQRGDLAEDPCSTRSPGAA